MAAMAVSMPPRVRRSTLPRPRLKKSARCVPVIHMLIPPASIAMRGARTLDWMLLQSA